MLDKTLLETIISVFFQSMKDFSFYTTSWSDFIKYGHNYFCGFPALKLGRVYLINFVDIILLGVFFIVFSRYKSDRINKN